MPYAKLRNQRIDRADLYASAPAGIAQLGRCNMIVARRLEQRQSRKPLDNQTMRLRPGESLQQLLQYKPRRHDGVSTQQGVMQYPDFGFGGRAVPA